MITANDARQLHDEEVSRKAVKAEQDKAEQRLRDIKYDKYVREELYVKKLAEVEELIKDAIKDGDRFIDFKVGEDSTGKKLSDMLLKEFTHRGFKTNYTSKFTPEDNEVCASDGYYGHPEYTTYTMHVEW